jgi:16S rRNA (guanine527-N7)-methyltransferase
MSFVDPEIVFRYFPELTAEQQQQFITMGSLYEDMNSGVNLVSRQDLENLYIRHILHSMSIAKFISFKPGAKVLDLGTGGGFPGIPLAVMFNNVEFTLVDSIKKKIDVVEKIADKLRLKNVYAVCSRAEMLDSNYDFIITRAVAPMAKLVKWGNRLISKKEHEFDTKGIIALKGGDLSDELAKIKKKVVAQDLSAYFSENFFSTKKIIFLSY